jgi:serine kinase of HPr protein (carbohydrate metabolism regulator)
VLLGEAGVLIRGPSGSGKSALARSLVAAEELGGGYAAHVADDRVVVRLWRDRLVAEPHPAIAGVFEMRGLGLVSASPHASAAVLRLVVDLVDETPRFPEPDGLDAELLGIRLARVRAARADAAALAMWRLRGRDDTPVTVP